MDCVKWLFVGVFAAFLGQSLSSKILVMMSFGSPSHRNVFNPILEALSAKGHEITMYSPFPMAKPYPNVTDISMGNVNLKLSTTTLMDPYKIKERQSSLFGWMLFAGMMPEMCEDYILKNKDIQDLRFTKEKFDVLILDEFCSECINGFAWKLNLPLIMLSTSNILSSDSATMGLQQLSSIHPCVHLEYTEQMNFKERLVNTLHQNFEYYTREYYYKFMIHNIAKGFFGEGLPPPSDIEREASLALINTHHSFGYPREFPPNMVEVGGLHCRPANPLPEEFEEFVNGAGEDGFIVFSLGSVTQGSRMPDHYRKIFVKIFGSLKQRVIWKWESETMPDTPSNVKLVKWIPQQDLLGHPKIKAFITHGGLLSSQEAAYHGVPLIGIPLFGDQEVNMKRAVKMGFAVKFDLPGMTESIVSNAINTVLNSSRFAENAKQRSKYMKDRIMHPKDEAVWWIEYVIRHKGAEHLKLASRNLTLAQYYLWDVWGFIALCITLPVLVLICICCRPKKCCGTSQSRQFRAK